MMKGRAMEDAAQKSAQQFGVEYLGQALVTDAAGDLAEEAGIGQDAGRGVEIGMPVRRAQLAEFRPDGAAILRVERQDVTERLQIASCRFDIGQAARADLVDQPGAAFGALAILLAAHFGDLELEVSDHRLGRRHDGAHLREIGLGGGSTRFRCR